MKTFISFKHWTRTTPYVPVALTFATVLYFANEQYRYSIGVRILEDALLDQVKNNDLQVDMLVRAFQVSLPRHSCNSKEYHSVVSLRHKLNQLTNPLDYPVEKQLASLVATLDEYVDYPEYKKELAEQIGDIIPFRNRRNQFLYHKSRMLDAYYQYFIGRSSSASFCCTKPFHLVQYYDPHEECYIVHLSHQACEESSILVNGNQTKQGEFIYHPEIPGTHTFEVVIQSTDYDRLEFVSDTIEYSIKVVNKQGS